MRFNTSIFINDSYFIMIHKWLWMIIEMFGHEVEHFNLFFTALCTAGGFDSRGVRLVVSFPTMRLSSTQHPMGPSHGYPWSGYP